MLKTKKLFLVAACCIAMAVPGNAFAAEETDSTNVPVIAEEGALTDEQTSEEVTTPTETVTEIPEEVTDSSEEAVIEEEQTSDTKVEDDPAAEEEVKDGLVRTTDESGMTVSLYYYRDGKMVKDEVVEVDGNVYYFTEDGSAAISQMLTVNGATYYFRNTGAALANVVHYFTALKEYCYLQENGQMYKTAGTLVTVNGKTYTFDSNGYALRNTIKKFDGSYYYFAANAAMYKTTGVVKKVNGSYYSFQKDGSAYTNIFKKVGGYYYYFGSNGKAVTNKLKTINGAKYYFKSNGKAQTGWKRINDDLYYFKSNGKAASGWYKKGNTWVYLDKDTKAKKFASNVLYSAWKKIKNESSNTSYYICVDTTNTHISIFEGSKGNWVPIQFFRCSVGKNATPTITGHYTVGARGYSFSGNKYTCYYYTQIHGDYLFHSILYNKGTFTVRSGVLGGHVSHGCVRLAIENAKWIYDNMPTGTAIYLYR